MGGNQTVGTENKNRRGTYGTGLGLVAALVAAGRLGRRASFAWQAWRLVTSAFVLCGTRGTLLTSTSLSRGRRGTYGTGLALVAALVAAGRLGGRASFAWQAWHFITSAFVLCGRRGTYGTGLALVAALVAAGRLGRRTSFAWQTWHLVTSAFVLCGRRGTF
eukprot:s225_g18.t1